MSVMSGEDEAEKQIGSRWKERRNREALSECAINGKIVALVYFAAERRCRKQDTDHVKPAAATSTPFATSMQVANHPAAQSCNALPLPSSPDRVPCAHTARAINRTKPTRIFRTTFSY